MRKGRAKSKKRVAKPRQLPVKSKKPSAKSRTRAGKSRKVSARSKKAPAKSTKRRPAGQKRSYASRPRSAAAEMEDAGHVTLLPEELVLHHETSPALSGGDLDADWMGSEGAGEETVGGSVATPDQDIVDEIGRALGVEQAPDAQVRTSEEILQERARNRWEIEREAAEKDDRRER